MENFFSWVMKPIPEDEVQVWMNVNNIITEKCELFYDFCTSLIMLISETYLGDESLPNETKIILSDEDKKKHFDWCWETTINSFKKENIEFNDRGDHYDYFLVFLTEVFYNQKNMSIRNSLGKFFEELFDRDFPFTKPDLDLFTEVYKLLDKNMSDYS
jgi:hypothetical protein